ncbi:MAG: hypothetical protein ACREGC_03700 [Minisyncoccia bacterium]
MDPSDASEQHALANNYWFGIGGVEKNLFRAVDLHRLAADQGNSDALFNEEFDLLE